MLGPSIVLGAIPLSLGYSSHGVRQRPRTISTWVAFVMSAVEALALVALVLLLAA